MTPSIRDTKYDAMVQFLIFGFCIISVKGKGMDDFTINILYNTENNKNDNNEWHFISTVT